MCKLHTSVMSAAMLSMFLVGCMDAPSATSLEARQDLEAMDSSEETAVFSVDDEDSMKQLSPEDRTKISEALAEQGISEEFSVVVNNPRFDGIRVDYCVVWAENCGMPAASISCKLYGYKKPVTYGVLWNYGYTYVLASDKICAAEFCDAIEWVVCQG